MTKHATGAGHTAAHTGPRSRPASRRRILVLVLGAAALLSMGTAAWALWSTTGNGTAGATTATLNAPTNVTSTATPGSGTVSVTWTGSTLSTGQAAQGYYVTRTRNSDNATFAACGTSPASPTSTTSCSDSTVPDGTHHYTVIAVHNSWTATSGSSNNVTVSVASKLAFTGQPSNTVAGTSISPAVTVTVEDSEGHPVLVSGTSVSMAIGTNPASGTLSGTVTVATNASGVATFSDLFINKAGTGYTLSATSGTLTSGTSSGFVIAAAAPSRLAFGQQPSNTVAGVSISPALTLQIVDQFGNLTASTANVSVAIGTNPSSGTLSGTLSRAASLGVATFGNLSINKAGTGYTLSATSGTLTGATSIGFNITAAAANKFVITSLPVSGQASTNATLGPITVQQQDSFGNPVAAPTGGTTVTLASTTTGTKIFAAASGGSQVTSVAIPAGASSVDFYYGDTKAGSPTITTSGSLTGASQTQTVTAAAANKVAFSQQPTNTVAALSISPAVTVQIVDQFGNLTSSTANVTVAIGTNPSSGTLSGTLTQAASSGVATFSGLSINKAGTGYTLTAISGSLAGATSSGFTITTGPASKLAFTTSPSNSTGGAVFGTQPTVTVQDAGGNTVTGDTSSVSLTITTPAGATLSCTTNPKAAAAGVATFAGCAIDKTGTYTLTATDGSLTSAISSSFTITTGPASRIAWVNSSATNCTAHTGSVFALDYTGCGGSGTTFTSKLMLTDAGGNPVTNTGSAITVTVTKNLGTFTGSASVVIPTGGSVSNSGGDGTLDGEIKFSSTTGSAFNTANTITATPGSGGYSAGTATFHK